MKKLLKYLSPFAPDQSGACGVLYELGGLIVICDAGGCSGNICGFDEPRWFTKKSAVFSAGLRDMDAIMGRDDRLIAKLTKAQNQIQGKFTAIIATPVPAVIGTDMKALKRMAEKKLGIPCITANAIGTRYYDEGEEEAWLNLFKEFAINENGTSNVEESTNKENITSKAEKSTGIYTGILGATPLETGYSTAEPLISACNAAGIHDPIIYGMGSDLEVIRNIKNIKRNLVVSVAGIKTAEYLKEEFGIPYTVGFPFIPDTVIEQSIASVRRITEDQQNLTNNRKIPEISQQNLMNSNISTRKILIIHTQFAANELRRILREEIAKADPDNVNNIQINAATFFKESSNFTENGDFTLSGEDELWETVTTDHYDLIIADGDIKRLLDAAGYNGAFVDYPHFAVSGRMNDDSIMFFS